MGSEVCAHATVPDASLRELYDKGHRIIVEQLVEKLEAGEQSPDDVRLFAQLMKQNNITAAPIEGTAIHAMAQMAAKLATFSVLEEKARVVPLQLPPIS